MSVIAFLHELYVGKTTKTLSTLNIYVKLIKNANDSGHEAL